MPSKETISPDNRSRKSIDRFERAVKAKIRHFGRENPAAILDNKAWMMGSDYHPLPFAYQLLADLGIIAYANGEAQANKFFRFEPNSRSPLPYTPAEAITIQDALSLLSLFTGDNKIPIHSLADQASAAAAKIIARSPGTNLTQFV